MGNLGLLVRHAHRSGPDGGDWMDVAVMKQIRALGRAPQASVRGFTLVELLVVIGLITMIVGIALPRLMPVIMFSKHEGAARRIASYGRSAIGHAVLMKVRLTVVVDLEHQEYWCEQWPEPKEEEKDAEGLGLATGPVLPKDSLELLAMAQGALAAGEDEEVDGDLLDEQSKRMNKGFDRMARLSLMTRAERVIHDRAGILDEIEPLFEKEFTLDLDADEEPEPEELFEPLLERTRLPDGCTIDSVRVGERNFSSGTVEIEITPLGLSAPVVFEIADEDGEYFTVEWDPITSDSHLRAGRASLY